MRVVIAEDLVLLRQSIARLLTQDGMDVAAETGDAAGLIDAVVAHRPDVVIADVRMPPTFTDEGAKAALLIRDRFPDIAVVMLSHIVEPALAMRLAADRPARFGYLLKDRVLDLDDFVAVIRRVADGGTAIDRQVVDHYLTGTALSPREREVLGLLAQGLSNLAIARSLVVSERTVDSHLASIFVKLGLPQDADHNRRVRAALLWLRETGVSTDVPPGGGNLRSQP
ncbi:response regulator transcription factor [Actinomadura sp. KC216]|uniref:response regulator transcription factor n=1 Tax=Actinomadura sp. KC216 TaxID=2530370 RepID=UPI0010494BF9|nr:response regulator transcription factor [Actinomadura sp. KC216]TDB81727.1 response regulator transcription factor [Actinomadura sp. KC216]